jgi:hypothetical protein
MNFMRSVTDCEGNTLAPIIHHRNIEPVEVRIVEIRGVRKVAKNRWVFGRADVDHAEGSPGLIHDVAPFKARVVSEPTRT